jgi:outer membrane protein assembly factor BamA
VPFEKTINIQVIKRIFKIRSIVWVILLPFLFNACNPTKKLRSDEHLLIKNHIIDKDTKLQKTDIESYIKQKPNRKILLFVRFHLWLYNQANEEKIRRKRILHDQKIDRKNTKRIAKGKSRKRSRQLFGEWLLDIGEPPVIYDSLLADKSAKQIKSFLNNKGYFISSVRDSVYKKERKAVIKSFLRDSAYYRKKASVYYIIKAAEPYTINNVSYKIPDPQLAYYVLSDSSKRKIRKFDNYDVDVLQAERERITGELNNNGYYFFTKDYIHYQIDTNIGNKKVNITLAIKNFARRFSETSDSIVESPHRRYYINDIFIDPDFISNRLNAIKKDTLKVGDYYILHSKKLRYKTKVLLDAVFIRKGELYQSRNVEDTYKRLSELKAFKTINISFDPAEGDYLNCFINLSPIYKQSFTFETEVTHTSATEGISGSISYQNRNLLRGAEVFELRFKGGLSGQLFASSEKTTDITSAANRLNTLELGPELIVTVPRFLLPVKLNISKKANPKTIFTSSVIFQRRPDYTRYITNVSFGYTWKESIKKRHTVNPLVINFVKVNLSPDFENYLAQQVHDLYTLNSFSNHLSTSTSYIFTFNEQDISKPVNFSFFKVNAESSGNILRGIYNTVNSIQPNTFPTDENGSYKLLDVVYSQYLRLEADYRYYFNRNEINKVVFRIAAGIGYPLKNFTSLPFERSFFSGGSNGIRAWQSRTLGPGSYADDGTFTFDQFGDGQLEANAEYRFKMFKMLNGAFFVDAGNVWLRQKNPSKPGGEFELNRFYKEIAIGSGVGLRADFNFFVLRLDVGLKVHDPQFEEQKRWVIGNLFNPEWKRLYYESHNNRKYNFLVFNIGINYPF